MSQMIIVSLPVSNLKASIDFYEAIGFKNNPRFVDETSAWMIWSETINFMLVTHAKWAHLHHPSDPAAGLERGDAAAVVREPRGRRRDDQGRRRAWRQRRHQIRSRTTRSCTPATWPIPTATPWAPCGSIWPRLPADGETG